MNLGGFSGERVVASILNVLKYIINYSVIV